MKLVLLTFVIGTLNFCIGYALAAHLGYGSTNLSEMWKMLRGKRSTEHISINQVEAVDESFPELNEPQDTLTSLELNGLD